MLTEAHIQTMLKSVGAGSGLVMPAADIAKAFNDAIITYGSGLFTTVDSVAALVSECMMESAYFRTTEEYLKTGSYAPYIGRTFIQLTWKSNYQSFGKWCYEQDLVSDANYFVNNPKALADLKWAALGGVWYFTKVMFDGKPLTAYSSNIDQVGKAVNLGSPYSSYTPKGQTARRTAYAAVKALGPSIVPTRSSIVPKILQLNAQWPGFSSTPKNPTWKSRMLGMVKKIKASPATLLIIQELGQAEAEAFFKELGPAWNYDRAGLNVVGWLAPYWSWVESAPHDLSSFGQMQRTILKVTLKTQFDKKLCLASTHLAAKASDLTAEQAVIARTQQAKEIRDFLASELNPIVLGGDWNSRDISDIGQNSPRNILREAFWTFDKTDLKLDAKKGIDGTAVRNGINIVSSEVFDLAGLSDHDGRLIVLSALSTSNTSISVPVPVETKPAVKEPILLSTTKRVRWKNTRHYVDERTHAQLSQVEANLKYPIKMYQGSWANGSLSASTHAGSGAADIGPTGPITWRQLETECRKVGLMAFFRPWANNYHVHVGSMGNPNVAYWLGVQIKAYLAGYDGLGATARASRDTGNRSYLNVRWENYTGRVVASTASSEEDILKWMKFVTSKVQKLATADKYQYVKINDKGDVSFATGPCQLVGGVLNLRFKNLPVGMSAYVRIVEDDVDSKGKTTRAHTLGELVEVQGSTGITWVSIPFNGNPGSKKGYTRRIRVEWSAPSDKVEIVRASVAYFRN